MNVPKGMKLVEVTVYGYELEKPLDEAVRRLYEAVAGLESPQVAEIDRYEITLCGLRPMTQKELDAAARARKRAQESAARRKEKRLAQELAEYKRLHEKFKEWTDL